MSISSIGASPSMAAMLAASQSQSPVVDQPHDGDSDDVGATAAKAAPPPGNRTTGRQERLIRHQARRVGSPSRLVGASSSSMLPLLIPLVVSVQRQGSPPRPANIHPHSTFLGLHLRLRLNDDRGRSRSSANVELVFVRDQTGRMI